MARAPSKTAIETLEKAAAHDGDALTVAVCQIALNGRPKELAIERCAPKERAKLYRNFADEYGDWSKSKAVAAVKRKLAPKKKKAPKKNPRRRKMSALQRKYLGKRKAGANRRRNPSKPLRPARRTDLPFYALYAQKGGKRLHFTGEKFSDNGRPMKFATQHSAEAIGKLLAEKFPVLKGYRVWAAVLPGKS